LGNEPCPHCSRRNGCGYLIDPARGASFFQRGSPLIQIEENNACA
jgi:hypothetical protein